MSYICDGCGKDDKLTATEKGHMYCLRCYDNKDRDKFVKTIYDGLHHAGDDTDKTWIGGQLYDALSNKTRLKVAKIFQDVIDDA